MAVTDLARALVELLEPVAESHGYELVAVEQAGGRKSPVIRVLLDRAEGLDIDAICEANRWVSDVLDEADPVSGPYTLEVSSPGVDRPLRKREDFERFAGEHVTVKTKPHTGTRSSWSGLLRGLEGDLVVLEVEGELLRIAFSDIVKARLKGVVSFESGRNEDRT